MSSPATSATEIVNLALGRLGEPPVSDITDTEVKAARAGLRWYEVSRDAVLEEAPWNFAQTRATLIQDATAPLTDWDYRYAAPTDMLVLRLVNGYPTSYASTLYQLEKGFILTDEDAVNILYTARITDVAQYPPSFVRALSFLLAADFSREITQSTKDESAMMQKYRVTLGRARRTDAIQNRVLQRGVDGMTADSRLVQRRVASDLG